MGHPRNVKQHGYTLNKWYMMVLPQCGDSNADSSTRPGSLFQQHAAFIPCKALCCCLKGGWVRGSAPRNADGAVRGHCIRGAGPDQVGAPPASARHLRLLHPLLPGVRRRRLARTVQVPNLALSVQTTLASAQ